MIVLISPEMDLNNEIQILHQLFDVGLEFYHFRKPDKSLQEHRDYLNRIDVKHHDKIITHYFHELAVEFNLKGIHLQEQVRIDFGTDLEKYVMENSKTLSVSSSFHNPSDLESCSVNFNYHLLSPVFSSISKQGYEGKGFDVNGTNKIIIGIGGVNEQTIDATLNLGYRGIGVLGGVWNSKDPVEAFLSIKRKYDELNHSNSNSIANVNFNN